MFGKTFPKNRHAKAKSYSRQIKTTPLKAWVLDTSNKQGRLTGTKVNWERLGKNSDGNCRNLFKTKPKKSTFCTIAFCVVFAVHDSIIDNRRAAVGKVKVKISPMHREIFLEKLLHENLSRIVDKQRQKVAPSKWKQPRWKRGRWKQQRNEDDNPGQKQAGKDLRKFPMKVVGTYSILILGSQHFADLTYV